MRGEEEGGKEEEEGRRDEGRIQEEAMDLACVCQQSKREGQLVRLVMNIFRLRVHITFLVVLLSVPKKLNNTVGK